MRRRPIRYRVAALEVDAPPGKQPPGTGPGRGRTVPAAAPFCGAPGLPLSGADLSPYDALEPVLAVASGFDTISLAAAGTTASGDRIDTKFVVPIGGLPAVLERLTEEYRILEVGARLLSRYTTRYYDTPSLRLYHDHHMGRATRQKVRIRGYPDTGTSYLEVKQKTNRGRTLKSRALLSATENPDIVSLLEDRERFPIPTVVPPQLLRESLSIEYSRLTLIRRLVPERVTFDLLLTCARGGLGSSFPFAVICEVKQERRGRSPVPVLLRSLGVRESELSKYCVGLAWLEPGIRRNRFRPVLRKLAGYTVSRHAIALPPREGSSVS